MIERTRKEILQSEREKERKGEAGAQSTVDKTKHIDVGTSARRSKQKENTHLEAFTAFTTMEDSTIVIPSLVSLGYQMRIFRV